MAHAYLLTGLKKAGKTTSIRKIVELLGPQRCGGFFTEEILSDPSNIYSRMGFKFKTIEGKEGIIATVQSSSNLRVGTVKENGLEKYGVELDAFEDICINSVLDALKNKEFVVIDEIGHMQLFSNKFKEVVKMVMESDKVLIGTIVLQSNFWADWFKQKYEVEQIESMNNIAEIFHMTKANRDSLNEMLLLFFTKKYLTIE